MNEYSNPQAEVDYRTLFEALPGLYLILKKDLTVVAASKAYLDATMTRLEDMVGLTIREIFPDNPDDLVGNGSRNVMESQQRVVATRRSDTMPVQKYDIARPDGTYEVRYWSPMHVPILGASGDVEYVIHRVEDVTEFIQLKQQAAEASDEAAGAMTKLEADIYMRGQEVSEANRKLREATREAEGILAHARADAERLRAQSAESLEASLKRREQNALDKIAQAETRAVDEVRGRAVEVAIAATARLLSEQMDGAQGDKLVDEAIAEVGRKLH